MPYSDFPPPLVLPDTDEWRQRAKADAQTPPDTAFCRHFRPSPLRETCANRCAGGERSHNWCFLCPAGHVLTEIHVYDHERTRDRAVLVN